MGKYYRWRKLAVSKWFSAYGFHNIEMKKYTSNETYLLLAFAKIFPVNEDFRAASAILRAFRPSSPLVRGFSF
jgi:hypothetical protein